MQVLKRGGLQIAVGAIRPARLRHTRYLPPLRMPWALPQRHSHDTRRGSSSKQQVNGPSAGRLLCFHVGSSHHGCLLCGGDISMRRGRYRLSLLWAVSSFFPMAIERQHVRRIPAFCGIFKSSTFRPEIGCTPHNKSRKWAPGEILFLTRRGCYERGRRRTRAAVRRWRWPSL